MPTIETFYEADHADKANLAQRLEASRRKGNKVFLISVEGQVTLRGFPAAYEGSTADGEPMTLPWVDRHYLYYPTSVEALTGGQAFGFDATTQEVYKAVKRPERETNPLWPDLPTHD